VEKSEKRSLTTLALYKILEIFSVFFVHVGDYQLGKDYNVVVEIRAGGANIEFLGCIPIYIFALFILGIDLSKPMN